MLRVFASCFAVVVGICCLSVLVLLFVGRCKKLCCLYVYSRQDVMRTLEDFDSESEE